MMPTVDASSPVRVTGAVTDGTVSITTGSFSPPACVLVATAQINTHNTADATGAITNNGTALTWTLANERTHQEGGQSGYAGLFVAVLSSARTGMTVTFTATPIGAALLNSPSLKVYAVTGADTVSPIGGKAEGSSTTNNITTTAFTTVGGSSLGFVSGNDWNALGNPTSSDTTVDSFTNTSTSGVSGFKTLGAVGSSATFNLDAGGTTAAAWNWVTCEIKAAAAAPTGPLRRPAVIKQAIYRAINW